jgi:hypothetical protein
LKMKKAECKSTTTNLKMKQALCGGRGSRGEQAKTGGRRGQGSARSDGEKIDRWAEARHDFEDNELGTDFWQK